MHLDFLKVVVNDTIDLRYILFALLVVVNNVFFQFFWVSAFPSDVCIVQIRMNIREIYTF